MYTSFGSNKKIYKNTVTYVRRSRDDERQEMMGIDVLQYQRDFVNQMVNHYGVRAFHFEEIESGSTIEGREEFKKLINICYDERYKIDSIICKDITRLSRGDYRDMAKMMDLVEKLNIDIITDGMTYSVDNKETLSLLRNKLNFSKEEYEMTKGRLSWGRQKSAELGHWIASTNVPYGYIRNPLTKRLEKDEEQARIVKMIYNDFLNGMSKKAIADKLEKMGIKTRKGLSRWSIATINVILTNNVYRGWIEYNKTRWVKYNDPETGKEIKKNVPNPEERIIRNKNALQYEDQNGVMRDHRIIDDLTFERAQSLYKKSYRKMDPKSKRSSELSGLVICEHCGKALTYQDTSQNYTRKDGTKTVFVKRYLRCTNRHNTEKCGQAFYYEYVLEAILDQIKKMSVNDKELRKYYSEIDLHKEVDIEEEIEMMEREIEREENRMDNNRDLYVRFLQQGKERFYTQEKFERDLEDSVKRIDSLEEEIKKLKRQNKPSFTSVKKETKKKIKNVLDLYNKASNTNEQNDLLKTIIHHVDITMVRKGSRTVPPIYDMNIHVKPETFSLMG